MKKLSWKLFTVCLMVLLSTVSVYASGLDRFTDVKSHWAASALERAVNDGVLNGSDNKLNPDGTLNASEMAAILVRKTDSQQWSGFYPGTSSGVPYDVCDSDA